MTVRKRDKPYACVDVDLPMHPRIVKCADPGGALGLWLAMTTYSREHLTDALVPKALALGLWGDAKRNGPRLKDLLANELLADRGDEYEVLRYAPRNQTKAMVEADRAAARSRMAKHRLGDSSPVVRPNIARTSGIVPASVSFSGSDPGEGLGEGTGPGAPIDPVPPPPPTTPEPLLTGTGRLRLDVVRAQQDFWIAAYERAVDAARGERGWGFPRKAISSLVSVLEKHCHGDDRQNFDLWIERDVTDFARAVKALGDDPMRKWSNFGPDGLLNWHNATPPRPGYAAPRPKLVRAPVPAPAPQEAPMDREAYAAAAAEIETMLRSVGQGGAAGGR